MNDKLYATIKLMLLKYDFEQPSTFTMLFQHSRQFSHGKRFKQFVRICQDMGVYSTVVRTDEGVKRVLKYDATRDKYLNNEITILTACTACNGSGVVNAPIKITDTK